MLGLDPRVVFGDLLRERVVWRQALEHGRRGEATDRELRRAVQEFTPTAPAMDVTVEQLEHFGREVAGLLPFDGHDSSESQCVGEVYTRPSTGWRTASDGPFSGYESSGAGALRAGAGGTRTRVARRPGWLSSSSSAPPCSLATAATRLSPSPTPGVPRLASPR